MKILFVAITIGFALASAIQVKIEQGTLEGFRDKSLTGKEFYSFVGIPFAKPPIGELRLKDPEQPEPWTGVYNASSDKEICSQFDLIGLMSGQFIVTGQEDCLYLNVFTPKPNDPEAKLPVMVFIHGGGYFAGSAKDYKPYVFLNEDVILVAIQYRLGPLGFLSTGNCAMLGNYGLKDQVMALKWVKMNIVDFGGDPGRVTIFGESAGAGSAHLLMLSPWAKGLFHGAILQSGNALCPWSLTRDPKRVAKEIGENIGCSIEDSRDYLKCLQQKEFSEILHGYAETKEFGAPTGALPRVDGDFIPDEPIRLVRDGRYNKVNVIIGILKNEGALTIASMNENLMNQLLTEFDRLAPISLGAKEEKNSAKIARNAYKHYLEGKKLDADSFKTLESMSTDRYFSVCHEITSDLSARNPEVNTYKYQLDWRGELSLLSLMNDTSFPDAVCHGDDLFYMFEGGEGFFALDSLKKPEDLKVREIFIKLWTNFAATGNPTPDDSMGFNWNPATPTNFSNLKILPTPYMSDYVNTKGMDFWASQPLVENEILNEGSFHTQPRDEF